jgi:excisionase family DNA binding protein
VRLINAKQAAEILGLRLPRLYELTRMKVIPFVRFGRKQIRFDVDALGEWVKRGGLVTGHSTSTSDVTGNGAN